MRKAIDELASENILMRRQGKGTFVASHSEPSYQYRFLRVTPDSGEKPHPQNLFFGLERGKAHGDAARALGLKPGAPVDGLQARDVLRRPPDDPRRHRVRRAAQFPGLTLAELEEFRGLACTASTRRSSACA